MSYTIKYNRTTNHIAGIACKSTDGGNDNGSYVTSYAQNACGSLTSARLATGKTYDSIQEAYDAASKHTRRICKNCAKAALALIQAEADEAMTMADQALSDDAEAVAEALAERAEVEQAPVLTVHTEPVPVLGAEHQVGDALYFLPGERPNGTSIPAGPVVVTKVVDHVQATAYAPRFSYVVQIPGIPAATQGTDASELHAPGSVPVDYRFPETYDKAVCADCKKSTTYANTKIVCEPIHRDGPVYTGMATRRERRVCVAC